MEGGEGRRKREERREKERKLEKSKGNGCNYNPASYTIPLEAIIYPYSFKSTEMFKTVVSEKGKYGHLQSCTKRFEPRFVQK